ncbi:hypothetical protein DLM85_01910 [Hymenobacter edaphi]|uniref:CAAX prenyl protease 2/Lysostaphin resistance protein A-like domain-containing protein n=2 Tax=Hymenobacter edaphi TaxID=2211146 RepID=A0A328BTW0_9BACT|nr:hypothetical protein DLM85_01910 [Hymenobacter edaphi]
MDAVITRMEQFPLAAAFTICVAAPVLEELLFRGVLLPGLLRNYGPARAILQSGLVFGVFHLNPAQALSAGLLGLLLGWVYWRTDSLLACMWLHFLNNAAAWTLEQLPAFRRYDSVADLLPRGGALVFTLAALLGLLALGIWLLAGLTRPARRAASAAAAAPPARPA